MNNKRLAHIILPFAFALILFISNIYAQNSKIKFLHYSIEQGLSQSMVNCIIQDSKSFMWFGTQEGLNRFDGYQFKVYRNNPQDPNSLSNNYIRTMIEDHNGIIWIGTVGGGLNSYNPSTELFTQYRNNTKDTFSISSDDIWSLSEDKAGNLWIGTSNVLNKFDPKTKRFYNVINSKSKKRTLFSSSVQKVFEDKDGMFWLVSTSGKLSKYNPKTEEFTTLSYDSNVFDLLQISFVLTIIQDNTGLLWFGTQKGGLFNFDPKTEVFSHYTYKSVDVNSLSSNEVRTILQDKIGNLWVGAYGGGVNRFNRQQQNFTRSVNNPQVFSSISNNNILSLYEDKTGIIWIGTEGGGINNFDLKKDKFPVFRNNPDLLNSLSNNIVTSFYEDRNGILWIGTWGGLNKYDPQTGLFSVYVNNPASPNSLSSNYVYSITEDASGFLWIGTYGGGLNRFDPNNQIFTHYLSDPNDKTTISSNNIFGLLFDKKGILWIATYGGGLNRMDTKTGVITQYKNSKTDSNSISNNTLWCVIESATGNLWIGGLGGIEKMDKVTGKFTHYSHNTQNFNSLSLDEVMSLYEDKDGKLWIGTNGGGLNKFDPIKNSFTNWRVKDGLPNDVIYGILPDNDGKLWLSTNKGISKFNPINTKKPFRNFDINDGLQSSEFNGCSYHKGFSGKMYFGGINGFNAFFPEKVKDNPYLPDVVITGFKIFNQEVNVVPYNLWDKFGVNITDTIDNQNIEVIRYEDKFYLPIDIPFVKEITLSYRDYVFSFDFASLHYSHPEKNKYAYIMEKFETEWNTVDASRRYATYTNMDPGEYTFKVKATNSDEVWSTQAIEIKVIITPPFWQTWWFRIFSLVLIITSTIGYIKYRERNLMLQKRLLEQKVEERTLELKQKNTEIIQQKDEIETQRDEIEKQRDEIENQRDVALRQRDEIIQQKKEITDSIHYAKRIQTAVMPRVDYIEKLISDYFILFRPRDIVSGDFYWAAQKNDRTIIAVADCTGHGVPGAFMSMLGVALLNEIVNKQSCLNAGEILNDLRDHVVYALQQKGVIGEAADGMDITLCIFDFKNMTLQYAGANNSLIMIRDNNLHEYPADKMPIGIYVKKDKLFTNHSIEIQKNDVFYMFSDGYIDQFGGEKGRKFLISRMRNLLLDVHQLPMCEQEKRLTDAHLEWLGNKYNQIDDILVMGIRM